MSKRKVFIRTWHGLNKNGLYVVRRRTLVDAATGEELLFPRSSVRSIEELKRVVDRTKRWELVEAPQGFRVNMVIRRSNHEAQTGADPENKAAS